MIVTIPFLVWFWFCLPDPLFDVPYSTVIHDHNGKLLGAGTAHDQQWRFPVSDSVPGKFATCIRYFEDEYFYKHPGVNPASLVRAGLQNIAAGKIVRGGSTLTMQVIRLARRGQARTYPEKIYECILALRLELRYSKKEILNLYAAHAPFGGNVVGLEAASWRYFNRPPYQLSWAETATLAVLPNAPALIFPGKNHRLLAAKRDRLLKKLVGKEVITADDALLAKEEELPGKPLILPGLGTHVLGNYQLSYPGGKQVSTTLDKQLQQVTSGVIQQHYSRLSYNQIYNAAALVVETKSGAVRAYVGNTQDPKNSNENAVDIIRSARSSGSTLKPFLYALMQHTGQLLPNALLPDIPTYISGYAPKNFNEKFDGAVPANNALARSLNVPAVRMLQDYGVEIFHNDLKGIGFSTINRSAGNYGLSLILGGAEVTLWDLVGNYRKMALSVLQFHNAAKEPSVMYLDKTKKHAIDLSNFPFSAGAAWLTLDALKSMDRPIEGTDWRQFDSSKTIAWKTGTSFGHKDAWAIGVTPEYVVGVWVGNADGEGRPGLTGASAAAPVMFDIFKKLPGAGWFKKTESDLISLPICRQSGFKASMICPEVDTASVSRHGGQSAICPYHKMVHLDASARYRVNADCYNVHNMVNKVWFVLPPVMEWYYKSKNPFYRQLPDFKTGCVPEINNLELLYPQANAKLFIPRGFGGSKENLVFEAKHRDRNTTIYWHLDDNFVASTNGNHQIELQPAIGKHRITLVSGRGEIYSRQFEVVSK